MSYKHFVGIRDAELEFDNATQRWLFLESAWAADKRGVLRMPQTELAGITLCSPRTIAREFVKLQGRGFLERLGHGRYQVVCPDLTESPNPTATPLRAKLRRWVTDDWGDISEGKEITVFDGAEDTPDFLQDAVAAGYLELLKAGEVKGEKVKLYRIHLNP